MAGYFVDSSALGKRDVNETGSVWLSGLVAPATGNDIYLDVCIVGQSRVTMCW